MTQIGETKLPCHLIHDRADTNIDSAEKKYKYKNKILNDHKSIEMPEIVSEWEKKNIVRIDEK